MPVHGDQPFALELGEHAIDMRGAEADHVADALLRQRHFKGILRRVSHGAEPGQHLEEEMREPLERLAAAGVDDVLGVYRRLARREPDERCRDPCPLQAKIGERVEWYVMQAHPADRRD